MKLSGWRCCILFSFSLSAQTPVLQVGSHFPDIIVRNITNAPVKEFDLNKATDKKLYLLNFWGTWCAPCIPEMEALARLQKANARSIQVIAISDDPLERKQKYAARKPSDIWLATDTSYMLYDLLGLASVGNCAIVNANKQIVAVLKTDSITQSTIDRLQKGLSVPSNAYRKEPAISTGEDAFGVDSLLQQSVTVRGYMQGQRAMGKRYITGPYKGRRMSWFNMPLPTLFREAYGIHSSSQEVYDNSVSKKSLNNFDDRSNLYCVDVLVRPEQSDSLLFYLRKALSGNLTVKVRLEEKVLPVYVLQRRTDTAFALSPSQATATTYSFSGNGFEGTKMTLAAFTDTYLSGRLRLPVVDETGLAGEYDIKTVVDLDTQAAVIQSIYLLGLKLEKAERKMPVLVYYR